jgi:hypothetical protein
MEPEQEIIVFQKFDNSIDANIAQSKLDAHGIPCFLTEENLSNLYPGQNFIMFNVRLHLFAKDEAYARTLMGESNMILDDDNAIACPQCKSTKIERNFPKKSIENFSSSLRILFFGIFFPEQKICRCLECDYEFEMKG